MSTPAEDRMWAQLFARLDRIDNKLDGKITRIEFQEHKAEVTKRMDTLDAELENLAKAGVTPDQVGSLIQSKLKEADAQGLTRRDRWIRWGVAGTVISTFGLLMYDRIQGG